MGRFDNIKTQEDLEKPVAQGGMSMGEGEVKPRGWPGSCPNSPDPEKRHIMKTVSLVQSVEHFVCQVEGCDTEWYD